MTGLASGVGASDSPVGVLSDDDPAPDHDIRAVLGITAFRRLWLACGLSSLGDWLGLLATARHRATLAPAAAPFLALPAAAQRARLHDAWLAAPTPDAWLRAIAPDQHGMDWPLFRHRLCAWAEALPTGRLIALDGLYATLAASVGPLADAHTHGFRHVDRTPCLLYTSPSPRDGLLSRMPSSA